MAQEIVQKPFTLWCHMAECDTDIISYTETLHLSHGGSPASFHVPLQAFRDMMGPNGPFEYNRMMLLSLAIVSSKITVNFYIALMTQVVSYLLQ